MSAQDADGDGVGDVCDAHFDTAASVDLLVAIASRSSEQRLIETVSLIERAARAWDAQAISRAGYQVSLGTALYSLTDFDTELAARISNGQLPAESAMALRETSAGIRQLVAQLYVHE